jgi:hypothetical protein
MIQLASGPYTYQGREAMCNKRGEIDKVIERYDRIRLSISDQLTVDKAKELIAELQTQKLALHPEQTK